VRGCGNGKAAMLIVTNYVSGDGKWYCEEILVNGGKKYRFRDKYTSTVPSNVTLQFTHSDGSLSYKWLTSPKPSPRRWRTVQTTFEVPEDVISLTIFHALTSDGELVIDNVYLALKR
jgi:hypothetical protein